MSTKTRATIDDLYKVEGKAELVNGEIVEMPPSGFEVTAQAGETKVPCLVRAKVLLSDDVINLVRKKRGMLWQSTIFTGILRPPLYLNTF